MSGKAPLRRICRCGCNRSVSQSTAWRHEHRIETRPESPPPPKWRRTAHFQVGQESFIITPDKQKQSHTDNISSNPSLPLLDPPPASNVLQPPEDALTEERSPGNFFRRLLSSGANCIALKVGTLYMCIILFPNAWMAEMHLSSMYVNYCTWIVKCLLKLIYLYLFPNSMSNLLIETSAIKTFPKSLSFKCFLGNFSPSLSSPFPKAGNLKQRSLKMFVLQLFSKLMPFSPTLKGCCRFHSTQKVGPWTLLTSNPSNALLAVLKTGGNGG